MRGAARRIDPPEGARRPLRKGARRILKPRPDCNREAPASRPLLPHRLVEQHAGGHRYIEALHGPQLRQADHPIAGLRGQLAQPRPLRAQHQYHPALQVYLVRALRSGSIRADDPQPRLLEQLEGPHEVRDGHYGGGLGGADRHLADDRGYVGSPVPGHYDRERAAQASAVRRHAPRLWGSCTPSSARTSGACPGAGACRAASRSSSVQGGSGLMSATTPW